MKVKLMKDSRPYGRTGEMIDVSPELLEFLLDLGLAEPAEEARERAAAPEKTEEKKTVRRKK